MKFKSIPFKKVFFGGRLVEFDADGEYETSDKELQKAFGNCSDIEKPKKPKE